MDWINLLFYFVIVIPSSILHEYSHGWMADRLGDPTARYAGRLTLDPRSHIDLWGTILMPLLLYFTTGFMFAYAKPVPYNPYNLRNHRWGELLVGLAGPVSNFLLALSIGLVLRCLSPSPTTEFLGIIVYINLLLMVFNLVPIPPLDGSKVLFALMPGNYQLRNFLERYGFIILIFFIVFLFGLLSPIINGLYNLIVG